MERKEKEIEKLREIGMLLIQYAAETSPSGCEPPFRSFNSIVRYLSRSYL